MLLLAENLPLLLASFFNTRATEKRTETDQNETSRSRISEQDRPKTAQNERGRFREFPENRGSRQRYRGGWYRSDTDTEVALGNTTETPIFYKNFIISQISKFSKKVNIFF